MLTRRVAYDLAATFDVDVDEIEYCRVDGLPLLARIYRPRGTGPFPTLIDVHGGAWCQGDRLNNEPMDRELAASGLVVAAIDFRLGPDHPYPASISDINYGIRWLKAHAGDFGGVADRLGGLGSSSGGHQILLNALRPRDPRYAAVPVPGGPDLDASLAYVIACWPVIDPHARYIFAGQTGREDLVERSVWYFRSVENMIEGNPQTLLDQGSEVERPPILILQGTQDSNIPLTIPERFVTSYRAAGGEVELSLFPDEPHSFGNQGGPAAERAVAQMKAFIARHLTV